MKNLVAVLAVALFTIGMNVNAQEVKPQEKAKKESCTKDKKACDKDKKACAKDQKVTSTDTKKSCDKDKKAGCCSKKA